MRLGYSQDDYECMQGKPILIRPLILSFGSWGERSLK